MRTPAQTPSISGDIGEITLSYRAALGLGKSPVEYTDLLLARQSDRCKKVEVFPSSNSQPQLWRSFKLV
jgi:hypothetical protein